jgi:hypothetical protein
VTWKTWQNTGFEVILKPWDREDDGGNDPTINHYLAYGMPPNFAVIE